VKAALLHPKGASLSDSQISEHVGVDDKTVGKYRAELVATSELPKSTTRLGKDNRTIDTAKIGETKAAKALADAIADFKKRDGGVRPTVNGYKSNRQGGGRGGQVIRS
jgi:hypothetical protein